MQMLEESPRRTARVAAAALAVGTLLYVSYLAIAPGSTRSITVVNDLGQTMVPLLIAAPALVLAGRRAEGRLKMSWYLLAAAAVCWGLGQAVWTWFEVVLDEPVPYPGLADVGYLGAIPFLLAGVLVFPSRSLRNIGRARAVLDGLITTAAMIFASYGTFLGVVYLASEGEWLERSIAVVYPVADVVTVAVVFAVLARRQDRWSGPLPLVAAGAVSLAVADSAFAYMTAMGTYGSEPVTDVCWPLGFALLALAAYVPDRTGDGQRRAASLGVADERVAALPADHPRRGGLRQPFDVRGRRRTVPRDRGQRDRGPARRAPGGDGPREPRAHRAPRADGHRAAAAGGAARVPGLPRPAHAPGQPGALP